ncbi:50S ribosomal protein L22 [Desulfobotulus sp. H1]|uniref:Large ribosomal subunit protein uL22 n=1 Tax=Desulfobotulus pelophilus TaxID=2823377 RepID=A0ABT3N4Q4_9BACT|nr:50S ribosomal protein L22 [Desulfobotulus pelophilus]MCW7752441.1 50S ribosomal protein L22 [Desulfobotulus pelophilus]
MEVKAVTRYARISPQKVRMIIDAVKGKPVDAGINVLHFMPQKAAGILGKTLKSAVANADQQEIDVDSLYVKNVFVDQGPSLKRFRPRARGRGSRILKRTSHITVIVAEKTA